MKLSREQIQLIDKTLLKNGVVYEDVKLELIDHIASDVEQQIENNNCSFEDAYQLVFDKWQSLLKPTTTSVWFFNDFSGPKIVVDKWISLYRKQLFSILIYSLLLGLAVTVFFVVNNQENTISSAKYFVRVLFVTYISVTIIGLLFIRISKVKTIYSRLFLKGSNQVYGLPVLIALGINPFFNASTSLPMKLCWDFIFMVLLLQCFYSIKMLMNHFKTIKKYKLI